LAKEVPADCWACVTQENTQGRSLRTDSLRDYENQFFTETKIDFIDYRSSNICNFKCRSCEPTFSHGIAQEVRKHESLTKFYTRLDTKTVSVTDNNHRWIIENLGQLRRLMFTGGEPTVIPEIKTLIQEIIKNHSDIQILITSNASFTDPFWFDITKKISNIHWTLSIDAVGAAAEIIRNGTEWSIVANNAEWLAKNAPSLDINTVVSSLNALQIKPLLQFVRKMQQLSATESNDIGCRHQFYVCQRPYYLAADNWPIYLQNQVEEYLLECSKLDLDTEQANMIEGLRKQISINEFDPNLWQLGQKFNLTLDQIRQQDHTKLFQSELV
jgi:organic radical activating enzyme